MAEKLAIGIDFGTDSCRSLVVDTATGKEIATHTAFYADWKKELYCNPAENQYRQHPQDHINALIEVVRGALDQMPANRIQNIVAIGIDTTGSTPCLTDEQGTPLALLPEFSDDPDAMFILWKDHTSIREADEINHLARRWEVDYTSRSGGIYSSEWFWAKAWHVIRKNETVRQKAYAVIEHCDWLPALLTDNLKPEKVKRNRCAAGHKAMWAEEWGGYPSQDFLAELDPLLGAFTTRMDQLTYTNDQSAGKLSTEWAEKLGLPAGIDVAVGILDAHAGAVGAGIKENVMVKIIGTSTCDIVVTAQENLGDKEIPGISGQVDGSVLAGLIGVEAGQSAFGDIYAWLKDTLSWAFSSLDNKDELADAVLPQLTKEAEALPVTENDMVAVDWFNGRRSPFADQTLKGGIIGLTLGTNPAQLFKALVEATAFGSRAIKEHLEREGVMINEVIGVGGISLKSPYVMQTLADIMKVPIKVSATQQAGALGVAMSAAVCAGVHATIESAGVMLNTDDETLYQPNGTRMAIYDKLYDRYKVLGGYLLTTNF